MDYILFDGAQLTSEERERLCAGNKCHAFYKDLGDEAAAVGPFLAPARGGLLDLATAIERELPRRHCVAWLQCDADIVQLTGHLSRLRYLYSDENQRYFFRFADSRAFECIWRVLDPGQKAGLFGPIGKWAYLNRTGRQNVRTAPLDTPPQMPPWRLTEAQIFNMLDLSWPDQLLAATLERETELTALHGDAELYTWTQATCALARKLGIDSHPLHLAMNTAVLHTAGHALDDPAFKDAVANAQTSHSPEPIESWLAGPGTRLIRLP